MNKVKEMFVGRENELYMFDAYRKYNVDVKRYSDFAPVDKVLRAWAEEKANLYSMMGNQLILSKSVEYNRDTEELSQDMETFISAHAVFTKHFFARLQEELGLSDVSFWRNYMCYDDSPEERFYYGMKSLLNSHTLADNRLNESMSATLCGQKMAFSAGQKIMRVFGKVARVLGMEQEFEAFRIAHSMVLNQAKLKGKLCLSIHPLDYATASDNESGWSSCMSWEERGGYRLGTVEMMTSPYVICTYLTSESAEMDICNDKWNSKKWRAWIIVHPDFIVVNRNYPYDNRDLCHASIEWVKELAEKFYDCSYEEVTDDWCNGAYVDVGTNYMYNDLGDCHTGCYALGFCKKHESKTAYVNVSGPAICMCCGQTISYDGDDDGAGTLVCYECSDMVRCTCCGSYVDEDCVRWGLDDLPYCEDCYCEHFGYCECCGNDVNIEDVVDIAVPVDGDFMREYEEQRYFPPTLSNTVCRDCIKEAGLNFENDIKYCYNTSAISFPVRFYRDYALINPACNSKKVAQLLSYSEDDEFFHVAWQHYIESVSWDEIE